MSQGAFSPASFEEELRRRFAPSAATCVPAGSSLVASSASSPEPWALYDGTLRKRLVLSSRPSDLEERIFYKFQTSTSLADLFSRVPALLITERSNQPLSPERVAGKTVVIGSSYESGKDLHQTPIGEMAGAMVVINQINALMEFGQFQEVSRGIRWAGLLTLIMIFSLSFSFFTTTWGAQVSTLILNAVLLPLRPWLFRSGRLVAGPGVPALRAPGLSEVHRHRCDPSTGDPQASTCELRNKGRHCESECPCLTRAVLRPWCLPGFSYRCSTGGSSRLRPTLRP